MSIGLVQITIVAIVSIISFYIIIFESIIIEIVKDFLVIKVIAELDNYFFKEFKGKQNICSSLIDKDIL